MDTLEEKFYLYDQLQNPVLVVNQDLELVYFNFICGTYFKMPPRKLKKINKLEELVRTSQTDISKMAKEALEDQGAKFTKEILAEVGESQQEAALILKFIPVSDNHLAVHILDFSIERQLHDKYKKQILELKETHEQIVKSDKLTALGEMIAGISHEIATPLTIVSERLGRMEASLHAKDLGSSEETLKDLQGEFGRIAQIISGMQSYARNQEDELQICNLRDIVDQSIKFVRELNILGDIQIHAELKGDSLAMANPLKLQQVFINLIKNSVDALKSTSQKEKEIKISIDESEAEQTHIIKVTDNGPGIPEEHKENIFEMFYTTKELGEGTGLGLNISQKIIEAHHGFIHLGEVSSGCEFVMHIPIVEVGSFTHTNRYLRGESEVEDEKVLVVGDDIELLNKVYQSLKAKNKVCIFSSKVSRLEELSEFFGVERAIKIKVCDLSFLDAEVIELEGRAENEILSTIEKSF